MTALLWFAGGFVTGAMAGAFMTVQAFLTMHRNSLPPEPKD